MKISQKQASLLAQEVVKKLKKASVGELPDELMAKIKTFKSKHSALQNIVEKAESAVEKHEQTFKNIVDIRGLYATDSLARIIQKVKEGVMPTEKEIEDKIILKSMFATDTDMETFISGIVKEFTKKKAVPASN